MSLAVQILRLSHLMRRSGEGFAAPRIILRLSELTIGATFLILILPGLWGLLCHHLHWPLTPHSAAQSRHLLEISSTGLIAAAALDFLDRLARPWILRLAPHTSAADED